MTNKPRDPEIHYRTHVFCCVNERAPDHPRSCCSARGSIELRNYMKARAKELGIEGIRVNNAGCLERCELGPNLVIYPEGVWYHYETKQDVDEILERHIINGERVERLYLEPGQKFPAPKVKETLTLEVASIRQETPDTKIMELVSSDGGDLPGITAGAHIDVFTDVEKRRSFSIASDPTDRRRYVIGVLREADGRGGSVWMHEEVKEGDIFKVTPPINNFSLQEDAAEHILIAGGIGITPVLAMGYRLRELGAKFTLHYCTRSKEHTAFQYEFADLITEGRVIIHHDDGIPGNGLDLKTLLKDHSSGTHLYYCGPPGFMRAGKGFSAHWPDDTVHLEYFTAAASPKTTMSDEEKSHAGDEALDIGFQVKIASSGAIFSVPNHKSIVQVLGENGIDIEVSCQSGLCRTCAVKYLEGEVDHKDLVLSESDRSQFMTPCCSRAKSKLIVLDL